MGPSAFDVVIFSNYLWPDEFCVHFVAYGSAGQVAIWNMCLRLVEDFKKSKIYILKLLILADICDFLPIHACMHLYMRAYVHAFMCACVCIRAQVQLSRFNQNLKSLS